MPAIGSGGPDRRDETGEAGERYGYLGNGEARAARLWTASKNSCFVIRRAGPVRSNVAITGA